MQEKEFNLLYEPWIKVLNLEGETEEIPLLTVLERAHEFRGLAGELPTQDIAILRLILATLYATFTRVDVQGNRKSIENASEALERWQSLWERKSFPIEPIRQRLGRYEERFYLFHPERPFYQVAGLDKGTDYPTAKLLGDLSESKNKIRLFPVRTGDAKQAISYAEAARWLIYLNAFDDSSNKPSVRGQNMPATGVGWLGKLGLIYANGENLFETLMLNFVLINDNGVPWGNGYAIWEFDNQRTEERIEIAVPQEQLTVLTLQSRRIFLQREGDNVKGYCVLGGDFFTEENAFAEQMTIWRKGKETQDIYVPKHHDSSKQLWRDFSALLADGEDLKRPGIIRWLSILKDKNFIGGMFTLQTAGVEYDSKKCSVKNIFQDSLTINSGMLSKLGEGWIIRITKLLSITEKCVNQLFFLAADLAKASGDSDCLNYKAGEGISNAAKAEAYFRLDMPFRRWLADINPEETDMDTAEKDWKDTVKRIVLQIGEEMTAQSGEKGIVGRWVKGKNDSKGKLYTAPGALVKFNFEIKRIIEKGG